MMNKSGAKIHEMKPLQLILLLALLTGLLLASGTRTAATAPGAEPPTDTERGACLAVDGGSGYSYEMQWKEVDRLQSEDKFAAAVAMVESILEAAIEEENQEEWARALVRTVQLRIALHGYETTVRSLRDQPWPQTPVYQTAVRLFYAHSLVTYLRAYSWEIAQRERVVSDDEIDLKRWTRDQIHLEAQRVFADIWQSREEWGREGLGKLAEYVAQNNYPPRIRGTLRDAVTYLWVGAACGLELVESAPVKRATSAASGGTDRGGRA